MTKKNDDSFYKIIKRLYSIALETCPARIILYILVVFLNGSSQAAITYFTQRFFDAVEAAIPVRIVTTAVILNLTAFVTVMILKHVLNGIDNYWGESIHVWLGKGYREKLHQKVPKIDPVMFENQEFLDNTNKAIEGVGVEGSTYVLVSVTVLLASYLPYMIFMAIYLFRVKHILSISILLIFVPVLVSQLLRTSLFAKMEDEAAQIRRENSYYEDCICSRTYFKETRTLGAFHYFMNQYRQTIDKLNDKVWKTNRKSAFIDIALKISTLIGYVLVLLMLVYFVLRGQISIGAFAAIFTSIDIMFEELEEAINFQIGGMTSRLGVVRNFIKFMDYPERQGEDKEVNFAGGIHANNICFHYPGAEENSIDHVTLNIEPGETIAIVGENGAGKSTLVRLLTGIYRPTSGNVVIGDADTKLVSMKSIFKGISGIFQNYQRYQMTLKDNVVISDLDIPVKENEIIDKIEKINLDINSNTFPNGLETMLSREFDGVDLSGGQWQRVAIGRGMYKDRKIIVLDEPTASIDPLEESQIYKQFKELSKGKLSILVTHRLGSARIADRIIVMDKGKIVEVGTHEKLIKNNKKYAYMFNSQAQWYKETEDSSKAKASI